jgi:hypothetical protein
VRLAVMSDVHVMGVGEEEMSEASERDLGREDHPVRAGLRRRLNGLRNRFWHWDSESRQACFLHALEIIDEHQPDLVILNGDYGGDHEGVGLSDDHTFDSAALVIDMVRDIFPDRSRLVFGDHDLGKYNTLRGRGGIRLASLHRGEDLLGIESFWQHPFGRYHLIGVNSSLLTLALFQPEALPEEWEEWQRLRQEHARQIEDAFQGLSDDARVVLFCHDPSALSEVASLPAVAARAPQILRTIVGHVHTPVLLQMNRLLRHAPLIKTRYPIARIISQGAKGSRTWKMFHPLVCPSTFGVGNHISGGVLFLTGDETHQPLAAERRRIRV